MQGLSGGAFPASQELDHLLECTVLQGHFSASTPSGSFPPPPQHGSRRLLGFSCMRGLSRAGPVDKAADRPFLRQWFPWIWSHGFRRAACLRKSTGWYPLTSAMNCSHHTIRQLAVHLTALSVCSKRSCQDICMGSNRSGGWQRSSAQYRRSLILWIRAG